VAHKERDSILSMIEPLAHNIEINIIKRTAKNRLKEVINEK